MPLLRSRIRGFFALQAILLLLALGISLVSPFRGDDALSPLDHYAWRLAYLGFASVFVKAWWTTRKPSSYRNLWAIAASCISLGGGLYFAWHGWASFALVSRGLITIIIGGAGLFLFCQGGAAPKRQAATDQLCET
jgi:hypothetical protein